MRQPSLRLALRRSIRERSAALVRCEGMREPYEGAPLPRTPLSARSRDLRGLLVRGFLFAIVERNERLPAMAPLERPREQPIREPGILRKARAVAVGPDDPSLNRALRLVLAVVPTSDDHRSESLRVRSEV